MRKVIITVVGMAMLTLGLGTLAPGAVADDDGETLTVILENRRAHHVDTDGPGPTPGDYDVITYRLDDRRGRILGNAYLRCMLHFDDREMCEAVFKITGRGDISVQTVYPADFSEPVILAVNGGTGRYQTVHGEGRFTQFANGRVGVIFRLFLGDD
jgi:hypothetical protein